MKSPLRFRKIRLPLFYACWIAAICLVIAACIGRQSSFIMFEHWSGKAFQIYGAHPDGSQLTQLAEIPIGSSFWVSPDGKRLAVLAQFNGGDSQPSSPETLRLIDLATGAILGNLDHVGQTQSEGNIPYYENVAWSPSGNALVFLRDSAGSNGTDISLYDLDTGKMIYLTNDEAVERSPSWSPDGRLIAFATLEVCSGSSWRCPPEQAYWKIVTIQPDGSNRRTVADFHGTSLQLEDRLGAQLIGQLCNLSWSPDSKYITFENDCRDYDPPEHKEVFLTAADGSKLILLTDLSDKTLSSETLMGYSIEWSSGNQLFIGYSKMAFGPPSPTQILREGILVAEGEEFTTVNITSPEDESGSTAQWSLDGHYVAWLRAVTDISGTVTVNNFTDNQIMPSSVSASFPGSVCYANHTVPINPIQWSPDGQYIAYTVAAQQEKINCAYEADRGIAVLSIRNNKLIEITKSLGGDNRLIGWFPAP